MQHCTIGAVNNATGHNTGVDTLFNNWWGPNTCVGRQAGANVTTGAQNVAIGHKALVIL